MSWAFFRRDKEKNSNVEKGKPPARVSPLFSGAENSPLQISKNQRTMPVKQGMAYAKNLPLASFLNAAALTAVSDQGPCPWTPLHFLTLCKFD